MTLKEKIKEKILSLTKSEVLSENPNDDRYTYMSSKEETISRKLQECKMWYYGDSDELLNFYTAMETYGNARDPIYNRNKVQYFWGLSSEECGIKRIHSGIPNAIITTLTNAIGMPKITSDKFQQDIDLILEKTNLQNIVNQKQMPLTLALGWGAFKPIIDTDICDDTPLIEWYNAEDVDFITKHGIVIGIIYKDYYKYNGRNYVLVELRRVCKEGSLIEYSLYKLDKENQVFEVSLDTIPNTANLPKEGLFIKGYKKPLGVPSVFFYDMYNEGYGRSIIANKIDLFDDLDQDLSQASQTSRVSTPVEYIPVDLIERGANGATRMPHIYNRQYVASNAFPNGDGELEGEIKTTQPQVNFLQYTEKIKADLDYILTGILSPATMGIDIAKKDNAEAQREKEKITIMTRNNIIDRQIIILKEVLSQCLILKEYMQNGVFALQDYEISVKFDEFANPSFESVANTLLPLYQSGAISTEMFIEKLYGDALSKEERQKEIQALEQKQKQDSLDMGDFISDTGTNNALPEARANEEITI